ncbi:MAG: LacI family DNA-binding transcriptional regulator [Acidimicrobiia bacterium]
MSLDEKRRSNGGVTLADVARLAGVHPSTVSRALDPLQINRVKEPTRQLIIEAATRLGYRPDLVARGLRNGRTATIGVIAADLGNTFVTPIIHGLTGAIESAGMLPMIAETQDDHGRLSHILDHMLSRRVDAIVVAAARAGDQALLESAAKLVPVVIAARPLRRTSLPQVIHDDREGGRLVAQLFGDLGHQLVAQLQGPDDVDNFPRRAEGFSGFCESRGITEIVVSARASVPAIHEGKRVMDALLAKPGLRPSAVFAHNDLMALGALSVIRAAGLRVPDDLSLVGYNDLPMVGHLAPPLTTVRYPSLEVGKAAGAMVRQLLAGGRPSDVNLEPELVMRESAAHL